MTPLFADGSWVVVSQTITRKKVEIEVPVKLVAFAPPQENKKTGKFYFPKLKNGFWQVIVKNVKGGEPIKVKMGSQGIRLTYQFKHKAGQWWEKDKFEIETSNTEWMKLEKAEDVLNNKFGDKVGQYVLNLLVDAFYGNEEAQTMPA